MHPMDLSDILKNLVANHFVQHPLHRFRKGLLVPAHARSTRAERARARTHKP